MLIGFQRQKDDTEKALLYINSTAPHEFDPAKLLDMLEKLVSILKAHLKTPDAVCLHVNTINHLHRKFCDDCGEIVSKANE